jgi:aminoglycoside 6'-N-acetyltransferase I
VKVRFACSADLEPLAQLRTALWPEAPAAEHFVELARLLAGESLATLPLVIFVAEDSDGTLAGFLEAGLRSHADGCDPAQAVGYVEGWYVGESYRRQGIARELLQAAEEWARSSGCREMASDTPLSNTLSQRVHEALGFTVAERAVLYRKRL